VWLLLLTSRVDWSVNLLFRFSLLILSIIILLLYRTDKQTDVCIEEHYTQCRCCTQSNSGT
jgi:hypothetical protein